jgi:hypothetical protein
MIGRGAISGIDATAMSVDRFVAIEQAKLYLHLLPYAKAQRRGP